VGGDIAGKELELTPIRKCYVWFNYFLCNTCRKNV